MELDEKKAILEQQISDERARLSADRMDISFGELVNLYKNNELIIRPLEMFLTKVDRTKYPNVEQEYRFELQEIKDARIKE